MRLLITGEKGELGSTLYAAFSKLTDVVGWEEWDRLSSVDRVIHCAARHPFYGADEIIDSNINLLREVYQSAEKVGAADFVFMSSVSVYGECSGPVLVESGHPCPIGLYGVSKLLGEQYLAEQSMPVLCVRIPAIISGRADKNFISKLIGQCAQGDPMAISHGNKLFNFLIARETISDFLAHIIEPISGFDIVNVAPVGDTSLLEIISWLATYFEIDTTVEDVQSICEPKVISNDKLTEKYGFNPGTAINQLEKFMMSYQSL